MGVNNLNRTSFKTNILQILTARPFNVQAVTTFVQGVDEFIPAKETSTQENPKDFDIIKLPPPLPPLKETKPFPKITGSSVKEIEKSIREISPEASKQLDELKNICESDDDLANYENHLNYIKKLSDVISGKPIKTRLEGYVNDPLAMLLRMLTGEQAITYGGNKKYTPSFLEIQLAYVKAKCEAGLNIKSSDIEIDIYDPPKLLKSEEGLEVMKKMASRLAKGEINLLKEHFVILDKLASQYLKEGDFDSMRDLEENLTSRILQNSQYLEKIKPGLGYRLTRELSKYSFDDIKTFKNYLYSFEKYIERLIEQDEPAVDEAIESFGHWVGQFGSSGNTGIPLSEEVFNDLVKLHYYSGILRPSRFVDRSKVDNQQEMQNAFKSTVADIIRSFEDPNYKKDAPIVLVILPGANDNFFGTFDAISANSGKWIQSLVDKGYKVFPFEVHTNDQILQAASLVEKITGRKIDLPVICGHGSTSEDPKKKNEKDVDGQSLNLGKSSDDRFNANAFVRPNMDESEKIKTKLIKNRDGKTLEEIYNLPKWEIITVANNSSSNPKVKKVTESNSELSTESTKIMKQFANHLSPEAQIILYSCGAGNEDIKAPCVARRLAANSGHITLAPQESICDMELQFDENNKVSHVTFYVNDKRDKRKIVSTNVFNKEEN